MQQVGVILKIGNERISLNSSLSVSIDRTNIPRTHLTFRTRNEIFWRVEVIERDESCLKVKVQDYSPTDIVDFGSRQFIGLIDQILFEKLDWGQLEPQLSSYKRKELLKILTNLDADPFSMAQQSLKTATPP